MKTFSSKHWHTCTYLKHVTTSEVTMADNIALSIAITISLAFMAYSFSSSMAFPIKHRCIHRINKEGFLLSTRTAITWALQRNHINTR